MSDKTHRTGSVELPQDIRASWLNPIRRLQSVARSQQGFAVISISVFVNADGHPVAWTEPRRICLEPKNSMDQLIEILGGVGLISK